MEYIMAKRKKRRKLIRRPRNIVEQDGLEWIKRAGRLWGDYKTCATYIGCAHSSFASFVWRHGIKTIKHGRKSLASKDELDRVSGAAEQNSTSPAERIPLRKRHASG